MRRSVEDVRLGCQVLFGKGHCKVPLEYRPEIARNMTGQKLKFGYYLSGMVGDVDCDSRSNSSACQMVSLKHLQQVKEL